MARIIKVRTVPRGYVKVEEKHLDGMVREIMQGCSPAELFMALYQSFGSPMKEGIWSYMLRHGSVVFKMTAKEKKSMKYDIWLSPRMLLEARRKHTKILNIVARRLNEQGIAFALKGVDVSSLYYAVRKKNDELMERTTLSDKEIIKRADDALTDEEKKALYGGLSQFLPEVETEIRSMVKRISNGDE